MPVFPILGDNFGIVPMQPYAVREQLAIVPGPGVTATTPGLIYGIPLTFGGADSVLASFDVPSDWEADTDLTLEICGYFSAIVTSSNGIQFVVDYAAVGDGEVFDPTSGTDIQGSTEVPASSWAQYSQQRFTLTVPYSVAASGDIISLKVRRRAYTGAETTATFVVTQLYMIRYANRPIVG